jgi:hypothetical protein
MCSSGNVSYNGDVCVLPCYLQGPGLSSEKARAICMPDGSWVEQFNEQACADDSVMSGEPVGLHQNHYWFCNTNVSWMAAIENAAKFSYKGVYGQLPAIESMAENVLIMTMNRGSALWIAASRDQANTTDGFYWLADPFYKQKFFSGAADKGSGGIIAPFYASFISPQPTSSGGALVLRETNGEWRTRTKGYNYYQFVVKFVPSFTAAMRATRQYNACGTFGFCDCSNSAVEGLGVACRGGFSSFVRLPTNVTFLGFYSLNFTGSTVPETYFANSTVSKLTMQDCQLTMLPRQSLLPVNLKNIDFDVRIV